MGKPDVPKDVFKDYTGNGATARHQHDGGLTDGATADDQHNRVFPDYLDDWDSQKWNEIYKNTLTLHPAPILDVADEWHVVGQILRDGFHRIDTDMKRITAEQWSGQAGPAAHAATQQYVADADALHAAVLSMKSNLYGLSDTTDVTKGNVATPDQVRNYALDVFKNLYPVSGSWFSYESGVNVSIDPETFELTAELPDDVANFYGYNADNLQQQLDIINESANQAQISIMKGTFDPGLKRSDSSVPVFQKTAVSPGDVTGPGVTSGPGSTGGGGVPSGLGGGGGVPNLGQNTKLPKTTPAAGLTPGAKTTSPTTNNPLSGLTSGLQQASGLGQNALSQAQSAAQKALSSQLDKAKKAALPSTMPAGLAALKKAADAKLKGLGGGGAGGGKAGGRLGGGGGAGGLGAGALKGVMAKEDVLAKGMKDALTAEERAMTSARGGASASPVGAGGAGGARGAGGEDKEHKANKYLRTTRNGEAILGNPPKTTPVVLKDWSPQAKPDHAPGTP